MEVAIGRPSLYSPELVDTICELIASTSDGLKKILESDDRFPSLKTVYNWLNDKEKEDFLHKYARARELQAELLADQIIQIADDSTNDTQTKEDGTKIINYDNINRAKLRVDARKWKASKLAPKKFGEKLDVTTGGEKIATRFMKLPDGTVIDL